jgi:hypothetical protein
LFYFRYYRSVPAKEREYWDKREEQRSKNNKEQNQDSTDAFIDRMIKENDILDEKPKRMSDEEWIKRKREDDHVEHKNVASTTLTRLGAYTLVDIHHKVDSIWCDCEPEQLRRGIYCRTCRLVLRVDKYMMELFKDVAEGRSPST